MIWAICQNEDILHVCMVPDDLTPGDTYSEGIVMEVYDDETSAHKALVFMSQSNLWLWNAE